MRDAGIASVMVLPAYQRQALAQIATNVVALRSPVVRSLLIATRTNSRQCSGETFSENDVCNAWIGSSLSASIIMQLG